MVYKFGDAALALAYVPRPVTMLVTAGCLGGTGKSDLVLCIRVSNRIHGQHLRQFRTVVSFSNNRDLDATIQDTFVLEYSIQRRHSIIALSHASAQQVNSQSDWGNGGTI